MLEDQLRLMTVHAHPDDESSKGAPTIAKYHDEGVLTVLVCCTGGEEGDILNPAMDSPEIRSQMPEVRREELATAASIIGYDVIEMLGYRDSGMAESESNQHPDCFARADVAEATGKLVAHIRRYKPHVLIAYGDDQRIYPHPDHLRAHDIAVAALAAAGDAKAYTELGEPWQVAKLYYSILSINKLRAMHDHIVASGHESPFPEDWTEFGDNDKSITTRIDTEEYMHIRADALRAHQTQIDPESPMWFGLPVELERRLAGEDDYQLAQSSVATTTPETDLFAGLR